ncbi:hypothetical protein RUND412_004206 [Rhizina undulata]
MSSRREENEPTQQPRITGTLAAPSHVALNLSEQINSVSVDTTPSAFHQDQRENTTTQQSRFRFIRKCSSATADDSNDGISSNGSGQHEVEDSILGVEDNGNASPVETEENTHLSNLAEEVASSTREDFNCGICLDMMHVPVSVERCHHTFCYLCLMKLMNDFHDGVGPCPLCRNNFSSFTINRSMSQLVELWSQRNPDDGLNETEKRRRDALMMLVMLGVQNECESTVDLALELYEY